MNSTPEPEHDHGLALSMSNAREDQAARHKGLPPLPPAKPEERKELERQRAVAEARRHSNRRLVPMAVVVILLVAATYFNVI